MDKTTTFTNLYEKPNVVRKIIRSSSSGDGRKLHFPKDKILLYIVMFVILVSLVATASSYLAKNEPSNQLNNTSNVQNNALTDSDVNFKEEVATKSDPLFIESPKVASSSNKIKMKLSLDNIKGFEIDVNGNIQTYLKETKIDYEDSETYIDLEKNATIESFKGKLKVENIGVVLRGKANRLISDVLRIMWKPSPVVISTKTGMIGLNKISLDDIRFSGSGDLNLSNGFFRLDKDEVIIEEFYGRIALSKTKNGGVDIHLDGKCKSFKVSGEYQLTGVS